jgi:hypothetical protein
MSPAPPQFLQQRPVALPSFQQQQHQLPRHLFGQYQQLFAPPNAVAADPNTPRNKRKKNKGTHVGQVVQQVQTQFVLPPN